MKAKVSASWCNLYYTHSTVIYKYIFFVLFNYKFLKLGGIWKRQKTKKDIHRLSNFYNWWFICILYPWSFLYWKLKEKKNLYWGRGKKIKNCLAYQCGLALTRSWVWPLAGVKQFFFFSSSSLLLLPLNDAWFLIFFIPLGSLCPSLHESVSGEGVGLGSSKLW